MTIPEHLKKIISKSDWEKWSEAQKDFIRNLEGKPVQEKLNRSYKGKKWEFGKSRPEYGETCEDCSFPYTFYAEPRNWSMSSSSDVWNLMKCANSNCGKLFESSL